MLIIYIDLTCILGFNEDVYDSLIPNWYFKFL